MNLQSWLGRQIAVSTLLAILFVVTGIALMTRHESHQEYIEAVSWFLSAGLSGAACLFYLRRMKGPRDHARKSVVGLHRGWLGGVLTGIFWIGCIPVFDLLFDGRVPSPKDLLGPTSSVGYFFLVSGLTWRTPLEEAQQEGDRSHS